MDTENVEDIVGVLYGANNQIEAVADLLKDPRHMKRLGRILLNKLDKATSKEDDEFKKVLLSAKAGTVKVTFEVPMATMLDALAP